MKLDYIRYLKQFSIPKEQLFKLTPEDIEINYCILLQRTNDFKSNSKIKLYDTELYEIQNCRISYVDKIPQYCELQIVDKNWYMDTVIVYGDRATNRNITYNYYLIPKTMKEYIVGNFNKK